MAETRVTRRSEPEFPSLTRRSSIFGDYDDYSPFSLFRRLSDEMDRAFSNAWGGRQSDLWSPPIEVRQKDGNMVVTAELPGIRREDVNVEVTDEGLCIEGERKHEHKEETEDYIRTERRYGKFYRCIPLPENAKADQARADFHDGVLEVTIPLPPEQRANRRRIEVQGGPAKPVTSETTTTQNRTQTERKVG